MEPWLIALVLKPFAALVLFTGALIIARAVFPHIPNGKIKRLLYDQTLRDRHPWKFALGFMGAAWGLIGLAFLFFY